jgi:hypothetical protein
MTAPSERLLADYLEGQLAPDEQARVQAYLVDHPDLRQELEDMESLMADSRELPLPMEDSDLLASAHDAVMSQLQTPASPVVPFEQSQQSPQHYRFSKVAVAAVAALFVGVILGRNFDFAPTSPESRLSPHPFMPVHVDGGLMQVNAPNKRHFAVQDLAVKGDQSVRILLDETSHYEINGNADEEDIQSYLGYIIRNDADPAHRATAVRVLDEHCAGESSCDVLLYALSQDPSKDVRREAAIALSEERTRPMVHQSYLKMMTQDPVEELRDLAMEILAKENPMIELGVQRGKH